MSLAIQWGYYYSESNPPISQGFIYFDAVTAYSETYSGSVSKNPISNGGNISDHFTRNNPIITFSGVISGVDISIGGRRLSDSNGNTPQNVRDPIPIARVKTDQKALSKLLPSAIGQLFTPQKPDIKVEAQPTEVIEDLKDVIRSLFANKTEFITLYDCPNYQLTDKPISDLVMTNFTIKRDPDSGTALICDFTLEKITLASSKKAQIPKEIADPSIVDKVSEENDKGKVDSTTAAPEDTKGSILSKMNNATRRAFIRTQIGE